MFKKNIKIKQDKFVKNTGLPRSIWRFYWQEIKPYKWMFFIWMIVALMYNQHQVLWPMIQKWFITIFETSPAAGQSMMAHALPYALLIIAANMFITLSYSASSWSRMGWFPQSVRRIEERLTRYVHSQSMSFWSGRMSGQVNTQISQIAGGCNTFRTMWNIPCQAITIVLNSLLLFAVNRYVALTFVVIIGFRAIFTWYMRKPMGRASKRNSEAASRLSGEQVDSLANYSVVKFFARIKQEEKHLAPVRKESVDALRWSVFLDRIFFMVPGLGWDIMLGVTVLLCVLLYQNDAMTIANAVFSFSVYISVTSSLDVLVDLLPDIISSMGSAIHAYEKLVVPIEVADAPNAKPLVVTKGKIEIKNLSFSYKKKKVLDNLSLTINPGERVGLVGVSGAGKTTLVNLIMRFYDPIRGQILIDGQNIKDVKQESLRENISFIPQEPTMFNRTLMANIAYGKQDAPPNQVYAAAKRASAHDFIMASEKKYNSLVGERGIKLSGGQRQRIAIARAFLKDAPILILDEATSALDSETEVAIQESFDELARNKTTIAIAHRLSTLRNMDRIVVIEGGRIVEMGTHTQLLRKNGEYARLWKMQSGGFIQE